MRKFLKRFIQNKSGLAAIWGIALMSLIFFPLIYWVMSVLLDNISETVFGLVTFSGVTASSWVLVKAVISALPVFVILIVVLWSAVNAKMQAYTEG